MRTPKFFLEVLATLDPTGQLTCVWDDEARRFAIVRRPRFGVRGHHKTLFHIAEDSGLSLADVPADDPEFEALVKADKPYPCRKCGHVHGAFKEPGYDDIDTLINEFPQYWPHGIDDYLRRWEQKVMELHRQKAHEELERWGPEIDEAAWALKKSADILSRSDATKEEIAKCAEVREAKTEARLRRKGLLA